MRRLLVVATAVVLVDSTLYAALTPLLPQYAERYDLSKAGAGLLAASYAAGTLLGGIPGGLTAARIGPRAAAFGGLLTVGLASVVFGLAGSPWTLGLARFTQGIGSSLSWAGAFSWIVASVPLARRGEAIGTAMGGAVVGAMLGPVIGAVAGLTSDRATFLAFALVPVALAVAARRLPDSGPQQAELRSLGRGLRNRELLGGLWLMTLPSLLFGLMAVLIPLHLDALGWGPAAIGGLWLVAAGMEAVINPFLGRLIDRRGLRLPVAAAVTASAGVAVAFAFADSGAALALLVVLGAFSFGALFTPGLTLIASGAEKAGVAQALAFGAMSAAWALGNIIGPAGGGALARGTSDGAAFMVGAAVCVATLVALRRTAPRIGRIAGRGRVAHPGA
jgi:predicted MFS family arabinose efflux permease